jgi:DNA-binding PadR family transcriptional regulator
MSHAHAFGPPGFRHFMGMAGGRRGGPRGRHRGGRGFGPWGGPGFGGGPPFGGRRRRPRGDVRAALLLLLAEEPASGYGLMQEIENRSEGVWRPSPGSVYPALAQLEDEGLVRVEDEDGRKRYVLTDAGKAHVEERGEELGEPWAGLGDEVGAGRLGLRDQFLQLAAAAYQVGTSGDEKQVEEARKILEEARRSLYRLLAGDESSA